MTGLFIGILVTASVGLTPENCWTTSVLEGKDLCSQFHPEWYEEPIMPVPLYIDTSVTVVIP